MPILELFVHEWSHEITIGNIFVGKKHFLQDNLGNNHNFKILYFIFIVGITLIVWLEISIVNNILMN